MLSLSLNEGEYITIGDNVVVQVLVPAKGRATLRVDAPREVSVMRGALREKSGETRPASVTDDGSKQAAARAKEKASAARKAHDDRYFEKRREWEKRKDDAQTALDTIKTLLDGVEPGTRARICEQLDAIYPVVE